MEHLACNVMVDVIVPDGSTADQVRDNLKVAGCTIVGDYRNINKVNVTFSVFCQIKDIPEIKMVKGVANVRSPHVSTAQ